MPVDRPALAAFLRHRREALQPEDVGLPRGPRRRTGGLRREEVAALCHMSADYLARLDSLRLSEHGRRKLRNRYHKVRRMLRPPGTGR